MGIARIEPLATLQRVATRRLVEACLALILCAPAALSLGAPLFGRHFPHGDAAVSYLYGPNGMWREQTDVYYGWNFYKHCETPGHPHDPQAMLRNSSVNNSTAPDANCLLLGDLDNDGEIIDDAIWNYAFHEHAGRGVRGAQTAPPFYQFWFDDNWVARYVAETYGRPHPIGLHDAGYPIRWRLLGADNSYWTPYPAESPHIDQIALNGLFRLNAGDFAGAIAAWYAIKNSSSAVYDAARGRYDYSFAVDDTYYYGLWVILSERLLAARAAFDQRAEILQHTTSLHATLLELQERDADGNLLGWRTGTVREALINTETTSLAVLALGANASWVLEPGHAPLLSAAGHYMQSHGRLSAISGQSVPGHVVFGPFWTLEPGSYDVEFALRSVAQRIDSPLATLDVYDGASVIASTTINGSEAPVGNQWRRYRLVAEISRALNLTEFRVFWHGAYDLDVGSIRVTRRTNSASLPAGPATRSVVAASRPARACPAPTPSSGIERLGRWLRHETENYVKYLR